MHTIAASVRRLFKKKNPDVAVRLQSEGKRWAFFRTNKDCVCTLLTRGGVWENVLFCFFFFLQSIVISKRVTIWMREQKNKTCKMNVPPPVPLVHTNGVMLHCKNLPTNCFQHTHTHTHLYKSKNEVSSPSLSLSRSSITKTPLFFVFFFLFALCSIIFLFFGGTHGN